MPPTFRKVASARERTEVKLLCYLPNEVMWQLSKNSTVAFG